MSTGPLRAALDATPLLGTRTGVAAFTDGVLRALAVRSDVSLSAYAVSWRGRVGLDAALPAGTRVGRRVMPARPLLWAWRRWDVPAVEWWTGAVDVVHGTNFVVPPTRAAAAVVTVHDLTPMRFPELAQAATLEYENLLRRALARGAFVHTPSTFVAHEVVDHFGVDPERVVAVAEGVPPLPDVAPNGDAGGREPPYVLAVGTIEPRKDHPTLVRAFDAVAADDPDLRLVIAGPDGWGADALAEAIASSAHADRIVRVGYVNDDERSRLLTGATAFAFPSRYEGFGLPPLEAMTARVPVVASDAGSLPEVLGDAALLVPVGDVDALATALRQAVGDEDVRARLVTAGVARAERYSWERCAAGLVDLYRSARAAA